MNPKDVQTDALRPSKQQNASEQTVIIGDGSAGGAPSSLAGAAAVATPTPPQDQPRQAAPAGQTLIMNDGGHTRLLPHPGATPEVHGASPVVGWLVVVNGPGKGNFRPVYPGSNTVGRASNQRVPINFGDDTISGEKHIFLVYDGRKRQFQLVPNLEKPNLVHLNDEALLANTELKAKDRIAIGQTTLLFVPLCGSDFDWDTI
jgi:hypothetical protein